jgi:hypothetical protein
MTVDIWIRDYNPPRCFQKKISGRGKHNACAVSLPSFNLNKSLKSLLGLTFNTLRTMGFFEKNSENAFPPEKLMVPSNSVPQELSNEWSCQYVSKIFFWGAISMSHPWSQKSPSVLKELRL